MMIRADDFTFRPPPSVTRARRVLIKPCAAYSSPYPVTTSPQTLVKVIEGIRRVSDADIVLLEGNPEGQPMAPIYKALGYDFPRVLLLDVKDCILVDIDNPLTKSFALASASVPSIMLSCDYWISVAPFKVLGQSASLSIGNLLGLLPARKYRKGELEALGLERVMADLYFTLPFDLGIIDARLKFTEGTDPTQGRVEEFGQIFLGEPYQVDKEATQIAGISPDYLELIEMGTAALEG